MRIRKRLIQAVETAMACDSESHYVPYKFCAFCKKTPTPTLRNPNIIHAVDCAGISILRLMDKIKKLP